MARGTVYRRGGSWYFAIDLPRGPNGRRRQMRRGGFDRRKDAEAGLDELRAAMTSTRYSGDRTETVASFAAQWIGVIDVADKTRAGYATQLDRRIVPELGHARLADVDALTLQQLYAKYRSTPRTALYVHQTCSKMLADAAAWGKIPYNPAAAVTAPAYQPDEKPSWTAAELAAFLETVGGRRDAPLWWFTALTGLRRGDVLGLRWGDVDLDGGTVRVRRAAKAAGGDGATKNRERRTVALDAGTVTVLREWRRTVAADALANGWPLAGDTPVWVWETGEPMKPDWMSKTFRRLIPAGQTEITLHGLRHSYLTEGARAGVHPKVMQRRAGHRDIAVTMGVYTHVADDQDREAAELIASRVRAEMITDDHRGAR